MRAPVIQKFRSPLSPWELYQKVYAASSRSFFLDSIFYHPPAQTYSYIGANPFLEVTLRGNQLRVEGELNFTKPASQLIPVLRKLFKKYTCPRDSQKPFFTGGAVGYWGYELAPLFDRIRFRPKKQSNVPALYLGFYRDLIVYDHAKKIYYLVTQWRATELKKSAFEPLKQYFKKQTAKNPGDFRVKNFRPETSRRQFETMVRKAKSYIQAGDIYQANLSQRFSFQFKGSSLALYGALRQINPSPFASFLKTRDLEIVSSSPERLVRKKGDFCETKPIAGTRPRRAGTKSEKELRSNEKERAEHIMLVDLERNDLGRVCRWPSVKVSRMMAIEKYSHVIHLVSTIVGRMQKGKDAFDLIRAMFPGGTITGCPKIRCMEIIDELEPVMRGIYTGSLGYLDFYGDLDLNIVIRTMILTQGKGYLQTGAGIVYDSDPAKEYEETLHKGEALVEALAKAGLL